MIIPDKIQIAGKVIDVIVDNKTCYEQRAYGLADNDKCIIRLEDHNITGVSIQRIEETFIHECLHFINSILHIEDDEQVVGATAELLYQIIKQLLYFNNVDKENKEIQRAKHIKNNIQVN